VLPGNTGAREGERESNSKGDWRKSGGTGRKSRKRSIFGERRQPGILSLCRRCHRSRTQLSTASFCIARENTISDVFSVLSEAADCSRILECVQRQFPGADIIFTGGVIYHLALSDVLANLPRMRTFTCSSGSLNLTIRAPPWARPTMPLLLP
jgi:hypothetical protein